MKSMRVADVAAACAVDGEVDVDGSEAAAPEKQMDVRKK